MPIDESNRIAGDVPCAKCGYNLRGQPADALCPECGAHVSDALDPRFLRFADPAWIKTAMEALVWMIVATFWAVVFCLTSMFGVNVLWYAELAGTSLHDLISQAMLGAVVVRILMLARSRFRRVAFVVPVAIVLFVIFWFVQAIFHLTIFRLGQPWMMALGACIVAAGMPARERRRLRFWWVLFMLLTPLWQVSWVWSGQWRLLHLLPHSVLCVATILLYRRMAEIAGRVPDGRLVVHAWIVCGLAVAAMSLLLFGMLLAAWLDVSASTPPSWLNTTSSYASEISFVLYTVASVWELWVLGWFWMRLRQAARAVVGSEGAIPGPVRSEADSP